MTDADLARQASRLRFADPTLEARFTSSHDQRTLRQWRLVTALGATLLVLIGLFYGPARGPQPEVESFGRFALVLPWFVLQFALACWPAARPRLQFSGALCGGAALALYFFTECFAMSAAGRLTTGLAVSLFAMGTQFLVALGVALPLRTPALATALLAGSALFYAGMLAAFPEAAARPALHRTILELAGTNLGIACVLVAVAWARERLQRLSFAQQEQLAATNAELARLNAEKNEFMAIAAHDLRAPLALVGGLAERLLQEPSAERRSQAAALIATQAARMLALVNDYLGAHAADSATLPVRPARLDLGAVAREAAQRHTPAAAAKRQNLELGGDDARIAVDADPALLAQIVDNFVTNALKFSPPGAVIRLEVQTAGDHPRARLAVIDQGPGIAPEEQARLFRKFSRTSARPTAGESSHGLGLAVAKRLAEAMDSAVGCDSEPGRGATFWVELPRAA